MKYSSLVKHASSVCAELTSEFDEVLDTCAPGSSDRASAIAENVVRMLSAPGEHLFIDLSRWHWRAGRLLQFKDLFKDHIQEECVHVIDGQLSTIVQGFDNLDKMNSSGPFGEALSGALENLKDEYVGVVGSMLSDSQAFAEMDIDSLEREYDDIEDLLWEPRYGAGLVFLGSTIILHPSRITEWVDAITAHDSSLMTIMRRYYQRYHELNRDHAVREDAEALRRDRFAYPPELYPWMWVDLEIEERKPLSTIFDFDPEDVKEKLGRIKPVQL